MANTIIPKRSSVAAKVPLATDLQVGEIAVNLADGLIYSKNAAGEVINLGVKIKTINGQSLLGTGDLVIEASGGTSVTVSETAPANAENGDLWWNPSIGTLLIHYADADTSQWVDANPPVMGPPGLGLPAGGTIGQTLVKASNNDYDTTWGTPAGGSGSSGTTYTLTTTNATLQSIATIPVATDKTVLVMATIVAKRTDGTDVGCWRLRAVSRRDAGNVADVGSVYEEIIVRTNPNLFVDVESNVATNNVEVKVLGIAAQTYSWKASVEIIEV